MKLKVIDLFCQERKLPRSTFLTNLALSYINKTKGIAQCAKCPSGAIGNFKLTIHSWEQGEIKETLFLCQKHLDWAKKEGADVHEQLGT